MQGPKLLDEISARISEVLAHSPVKDLEKNVRAGLGTVFNRLDLVTREEFEAQGELLIRTREKLSELEARVAELEKNVRAG